VGDHPGLPGPWTLLKLLNAGNYRMVPAQFGRWIFADGAPVDGLRTRRADEAALFARPMAVMPPAGSACATDAAVA
jgi:GH24 family phage-related lysozyme (muramidase)